MSTALVHGIAVPHARLTRLDRSYVLFGRAAHGIEWEAIDDQPVTSIFLILSPEEDQHEQLAMLADLGRCVSDADCRAVLTEARDCRAISRAINHAARA
jgi:mannitol/fructose-specific phosphotransferase system IIA component (Ntr-type)